MKLLIVAALIAVCSAASLEHLEQRNSQELQPEASKADEPNPDESQVQEQQEPAEEPKAEEGKEENVQKQLKEYLPPHAQGSASSINQYLPPRRDSNGNSAGVDSRFAESNQSSVQAQEKDPFANIPQQAFDEKTGYIY